MEDNIRVGICESGMASEIVGKEIGKVLRSTSQNYFANDTGYGVNDPGCFELE